MTEWRLPHRNRMMHIGAQNFFLFFIPSNISKENASSIIPLIPDSSDAQQSLESQFYKRNYVKIRKLATST